MKDKIDKLLRRPTALMVIALLGIILLFFNKLAFSRLILARGDTFLYFYPYWQAAADSIRAWHVPLWNPDIFMGAPFLANSQVGFFYPLNWPLWWLLDTPYAVSASIILHLFIAGIGTYFVGRRVLRLGQTGALIAAISFALGGYLTAQVEHINQLQGLSWLPWFLLVIARPSPSVWWSWLKRVVLTAALFSLQLLGGHTQTVFITIVAVAIWSIAQLFDKSAVSQPESDETPVGFFKDRLAPAVVILLGGGLLAGFLSAIQLLPTLELTRFSARQGGLPVNEVLSFSLNPVHWTRAFLPAYGLPLFSEYVAFLPLILLALSFVAAWHWREKRGVIPALTWVITGVFLASGLFNPINWLLARVPVFNFFRVPARWLVLYALGVSFLAGIGWQIVRDYLLSEHQDENEKREAQRKISRSLLTFLVIAALLMIWGDAAGLLVGVIPPGPEAPYESPTRLMIWGWIFELLLVASLLFLIHKGRKAQVGIYVASTLMLLGLAAHFWVTRTLPYNNLTTAAAYFDLRPPSTRLLAEAGDRPLRFLSLSEIFFDPGDQGEIDSIYAGQLPEAAMYDYTIAIKQKEIIAPNLSMVYGIPAVDGFDGGVLPLQAYSELMSLILPEDTRTTDGRLREHLEAVPEAHWLDLFNTGYLITDKVGDLWVGGVFYDRQHPVQLTPDRPVPVGYIPSYESTAIRLLASGEPAQVNVLTADGQRWQLETTLIDQGHYQAVFPGPATPLEIVVDPCLGPEVCTLEAITLVDERDGTFQALVPGNYRLIHSGDVKIYENMDVQPRAFIVRDWQNQPTIEASIAAMRQPGFDSAQSAVLLSSENHLSPSDGGQAPANSLPVEISATSPESLRLRAFAADDAFLILTDTNFPGWEAEIDGKPTPIYQADGLFRGVFLPAGAHEITFTYQPRSYRVGMTISILALTLVIILLLYFLLTPKRNLPA